MRPRYAHDHESGLAPWMFATVELGFRSLFGGHTAVSRTPEQCRHFHVGAAGPSCQLLATLLGDERFPVDRAVCEACCTSFEPTTTDLNPVVASLAFDASDRRLQEARGTEAQQDRLAQLRERAERQIPLADADEEAVATPVAGQHRWTLEELVRRYPLSHLEASTETESPRVERDLAATSEPTKPHRAIREWAVGVTTAPRRVPTLAESLESLARAGWQQPHLFIEGEVELPSWAGQLSRTQRNPPTGAWPNFVLALHELLLRQPSADAYAIVQDDAVFPDGPIRSLLEATFWRHGHCDRQGRAAISLYCREADQAECEGWGRFPEHWRYGAVAIVLSPAAARQFVHSQMASDYGEAENPLRLYFIDEILGRWLHAHRVPLWRPTPSVVEHIGDVSTLWEHSRAVSDRRATRSLWGMRGDEPEQHRDS